jgi:hypothetical protein
MLKNPTSIHTTIEYLGAKEKKNKQNGQKGIQI